MNIIETLVSPITKLLDKFIPDKDTKIKLAHEIATMAGKQAHEVALAQLEVNKAEAASASIFKGGWRPFIGWTCGVAFCYHFVLQPLILFVAVLYGAELPELPTFDMSSLMTVLMGMLGLGSLRTFEKYKKVTK